MKIMSYLCYFQTLSVCVLLGQPDINRAKQIHRPKSFCESKGYQEQRYDELLPEMIRLYAASSHSRANSVSHDHKRWWEPLKYPEVQLGLVNSEPFWITSENILSWLTTTHVNFGEQQAAIQMPVFRAYSRANFLPCSETLLQPALEYTAPCKHKIKL